MRREYGVALAVASLGLSAPTLRADTIQQFNVSGSIVSFQSDSCTSGEGCPTGSLSGTLTVDTTAGSIVSSALSATNNGSDYSFGQATSQGPAIEECDHADGGGCFFDTYSADYTGNGGSSLNLYLDTSATVDGSLKGYQGGVICNEAYLCGSDIQLVLTMLNVPGSTYFEYVAGDDAVVTPGAVLSPEPSSLVLLGTGVLGAAGAVRRRITRRR